MNKANENAKALFPGAAQQRTVMQINSNAAIMVRDTDAAWPAWAQDLDCHCHLTVKTLSTSLHHCAFIIFRETGKRSREANPSTRASLLIYIRPHFRTSSCRPILCYIRTVPPKFDLLTLMSFQTVRLVFLQWNTKRVVFHLMKVDGDYRAVTLQKANKNNIKLHRSSPGHILCKKQAQTLIIIHQILF